MTGFGRAVGVVGGDEVRIEARSVNHRYLQVKARLPVEHARLEPELEAQVRQRLERGAISITVSQTRTRGSAAAHVDFELARRYREQLAQLATDLDLEGGVSLAMIASLPGVVAAPEPEGDEESRGKALLRIVGEALRALVAMREKEGTALAKDLRKHAKAAERITMRIQKRMPKVVREHHAATRRRVEELLGGARALAENELAREVALLAERLDVAEELSRFASHLAQLESILEQGGTVGRKLDFLMTELQREANTIGSKCSDAEVAHDVIELKTLVERLREQVQNIE